MATTMQIATGVCLFAFRIKLPQVVRAGLGWNVWYMGEKTAENGKVKRTKGTFEVEAPFGHFIRVLRPGRRLYARGRGLGGQQARGARELRTGWLAAGPRPRPAGKRKRWHDLVEKASLQTPI